MKKTIEFKKEDQSGTAPLPPATVPELSREELLGILHTPAPYNVSMAEIRNWPTYGTCRFCGQIQTQNGYATQEAADEGITRYCKCIAAQQYRRQMDAEEHRTEALREAAERIDLLFGEGAEFCGDDYCMPCVIQVILDAAANVYDGTMLSAKIKINGSMQADVSKGASGNLKIKRKNSGETTVEIQTQR
ncbi:MAG: hypothetical protein ACK5JF_02695 [Oscillospiraceae bacterium]